MTSSTESKLDALLGLDNAKRLIRKLASEETGVHAVLLYGTKGSGKGALADILAEAWLCTARTPTGACGACRACGAIGRGTNSDLLSIYPAGASSLIRLGAITPTDASKPEDGVPLREFFRTAPLASRHKVAILHDAHRMNLDAANALLKTLEEPFPYAKLILTTDAIGSVLPSLLSRCLAVACELPSAEEVRAMFPEATEDDFRLSEGTPGRLKIVLKHAAAYRPLATFARSLATRPTAEALKAAEEFRGIAESIDKARGLGARAANAEALDGLAAFLAREPEADPRWAQLAIGAHRRIQGNANAALVFDALFTRILTRRKRT